MEWVRGLVVRAAAGRDRGGLFTVLGAEGNMALICDGKRRSLSRPKRKNRKHLFHRSCAGRSFIADRP